MSHVMVPSTLQVEQTGSGSWTLRWLLTESVEPDPISGWRVEVSMDRGITWTVAIPDTGASVPTANFNDLSGGTSYRFRVRPVSGSRIGPPIAASSDTSSVEPPRAGATQALPMLAAALPSCGSP